MQGKRRGRRFKLLIHLYDKSQHKLTHLHSWMAHYDLCTALHCSLQLSISRLAIGCITALFHPLLHTTWQVVSAFGRSSSLHDCTSIAFVTQYSCPICPCAKVNGHITFSPAPHHVVVLCFL